MKISGQAFGKLILSGEHSVVYGKPALAMALNNFVATTTINVGANNHSPLRCGNDEILFSLPNINYKNIISVSQLRELKSRLDNNYLNFLHGKCAALLQYAFIHCCERLNIKLSGSLEIYTNSNILIGCGMGSSAAVIMSLIRALVDLYGLNGYPDNYLQFGRDVENLQHGRSSGLDLYLAAHGGCVRFDNQNIVSRAMPKIPLILVNTGKPITITGECVSFAAKYFRGSNTMADDFAAVTDAFDAALMANNLPNIKECIRANHRLLTQIGVVPEKAQDFIAKIESLSGAAKICGAGACTGENAGIILVTADSDITSLVNDYGYEII